MKSIYLATDSGVIRADASDGEWHGTPAGLGKTKVTAIAARVGVLLAGTRDGIWRSTDGGGTWTPSNTGLAERHVRWLAWHPRISDFVLAGTEPAGLYISTDGGRRWEGRPEVVRLRKEKRWYLPYSPEAGAVRGFAPHGDRLYGAVEVGGVLRSDDRGGTWRLLAVPNKDVHDVAVDPRDGDRVFAIAQGGLFLSENGGEQWRRAYDTPYVRAMAMDSDDPDHLLLGPAAGVGRGGRVVRSTDGGATWTAADRGLATPWPGTMVERFLFAGGKALAILDDGTLRMAQGDELAWRTILAEVPRVHAATVGQ